MNSKLQLAANILAMAGVQGEPGRVFFGLYRGTDKVLEFINPQEAINYVERDSADTQGVVWQSWSPNYAKTLDKMDLEHLSNVLASISSRQQAFLNFNVNLQPIYPDGRTAEQWGNIVAQHINVRQARQALQWLIDLANIGQRFEQDELAYLNALNKLPIEQQSVMEVLGFEQGVIAMAVTAGLIPQWRDSGEYYIVFDAPNIGNHQIPVPGNRQPSFAAYGTATARLHTDSETLTADDLKRAKDAGDERVSKGFAEVNSVKDKCDDRR